MLRLYDENKNEKKKPKNKNKKTCQKIVLKSKYLVFDNCGLISDRHISINLILIVVIRVSLVYMTILFYDILNTV